MKKIIAMCCFMLAFAAGASASAYHSCAGWGTSCGKILDITPTPSRTEFDALISCDASNCAVECQAYVASIQQCIATQNASTTIAGATDECMRCQAGIDQWAGTGCNGPLTTCSYDTTNCTTCASWIGSGGDGDNLCQQPPPGTKTSIDYSIELSSCVCSVGCASQCAAICVDNGAGFKYIDNSQSLTFSCVLCMFGTCGSQYSNCVAD